MAQEQTPRTFTKEVDGETKTRTVITPQDEVEATFEGFTEQPGKAAKSTAGGAGAGSTNSAK